jgi:phosphoglycolate phosphatase
MKNYKHIIWDWNGTLLNDLWLCVDIINSLLLKYKKPLLTLKKYHEIFDFPVKDYYERAGFDFNVLPFEVVGTEFMELYWKRWQECELHSNVIKVLSDISQNGISQSILSAADSSLLSACVSFYKVAPFFSHLNGLDHHYATGKIDLAKQFIKNVAFDKKEILLIGDTTHDFVVSNEIGVDCILFSEGHHPVNKLRTCGVPVFVKLLDLISFLKH